MDVIGAGRVLTIDIVDIHELDHPRIEFLHGSSTDPAIVERGPQRLARRRGSGDGDPRRQPRRDHVAAELELYAPLVTPGSLC